MMPWLWSKHNILIHEWLQTELAQVQRGNKYNCGEK